ncbi:MAG: TRAP transporter TatT component family protein [Nitrospinota bacterium]
MLLVGCTGEQMLVRTSVGLARLGAAAIQEEEDLALAEEATAAQLKLAEGMLKADPTNPDLLLLLAQGFGGYAFAFVEPEDPERAAAFYRRGLTYGWRLIDHQLGVTPALAGNDEAEVRRALAGLSAEAVPGLFWTAYNWAGWINLARDNPAALADYWKVEAMMARTLELDETYYDGGAHLFFLMAFASRPALLGGNLDKAKGHYERVVELTEGNFLLAHVLFAASYAVQAQDRELFVRLCKRVLEAPPTTTARWALLDAVARQRATILLEDIDAYF